MKSIALTILFLMRKDKYTAEAVKLLIELFGVDDVRDSMGRLINKGYVNNEGQLTSEGVQFAANLLSTTNI